MVSCYFSLSFVFYNLLPLLLWTVCVLPGAVTLVLRPSCLLLRWVFLVAQWHKP